MNSILLLAALSVAIPEERLAVLAVAEPPGPEPELVELTHQLRAACRDRDPGVLEVAEMRARLLGQESSATVPELERAYGGAMATYQNGEYASTIRTLRAIIEDLERIPETPESYAQWLRANLRLAHAELTAGHPGEFREALERVAALEPRHRPDPEQFSPTFRRDFDAARARVAARAKHRLTVVTAGGWSATVTVNGKPVGSAPAVLQLPPGRYRIGGSTGALRVPTVWVDLGGEDRRVVLDFALAEALRINAGPALAVRDGARSASVVGAGAWLGSGRVLAASVASESRVQFLVGTLFDVRRGAVVREGRVRMAAGAVPAGNVAALAAFLLTGQTSQAVLNSTPSPAALPQALAPSPSAPGAPTAASTRAAPDPLALRADPATASGRALRVDPASPAAAATRAGWVKPAAFGSAALALGLGGLAVQQGLSARSSYASANGLVRADGVVSDPTRHDAMTAAGDRARRNAWAGAAGTAAFAAAAGFLGYLAWTDTGAPAVRF